MRAWGLIAAVVALALAGCGDEDSDDDGGGERKPAVAKCTPAPEGTKKLTVTPKFKAGDERAITVEKTREDSEQPQPLRATGEADLRVLTGGPKQATLRWQTDEISLPLPQNVDREAIDRMKEVTEEIPIEYSTNSKGALGELRNIPEMREAVGRMFDEMEKIDPRLKQVAQVARSIIQSEESLRATMAGDILLLHGVYGLDLEQGKPFDTAYQLPNPLGGDPIPAEATFELETARDPNGCAVIRTVIDPDVEALTDALTELAERVGGPQPTEEELAGYKLRNAGRFTFDPGSGWVLKVDATRDISLKGVSRTDRTVLTNAPGG